MTETAGSQPETEGTAAEVFAEADQQPLADPAPGEDRPDDNEAAKYRRRLRDTEKERDTLVSRLESLQRSEIQRLAAEHLADGADVWRDGATVSDVLNDDGDIDPAKVAELARGLRAAHPHWSKRHPAAALATEVTARGKIEGDAEIASWAELLKDRSGR